MGTTEKNPLKSAHRGLRLAAPTPSFFSSTAGGKEPSATQGSLQKAYPHRAGHTRQLLSGFFLSECIYFSEGDRGHPRTFQSPRHAVHSSCVEGRLSTTLQPSRGLLSSQATLETRPAWPRLPSRCRKAHSRQPPRYRRPLRAGEGAAAALRGGGKDRPPDPGRPPYGMGKSSPAPPLPSPQRRYRPRAPPSPGASNLPLRHPGIQPRRHRHNPEGGEAAVATATAARPSPVALCPAPPTSAPSPARPGWGSRPA